MVYVIYDILVYHDLMVYHVIYDILVNIGDEISHRKHRIYGMLPNGSGGISILSDGNKELPSATSWTSYNVLCASVIRGRRKQLQIDPNCDDSMCLLPHI